MWVCHALGRVVFNPANHKVVSLRDSPDPLCLLPSHCPNAPNDPSSRMYSSGLTIWSGRDSLGSSLPCLLCLSLVWHMCTCLNLLHILHNEANTLQWYTQCSRITVRYNNGSIVDKKANTNAVCLCVCWRSTDKLIDIKVAVCTASISINKQSIVSWEGFLYDRCTTIIKTTTSMSEIVISTWVKDEKVSAYIVYQRMRVLG